ncbi:DEAD/DEAH box helicase [Leucobacter albus]|uniref:DEAD/DEAH box helicase n=1 Tax=Leucobacter albus TaxID=272210 RepID=A0ABW3TP45_9MICO
MTETTFSALGVPAPLVASLAAEGKTTAFPIQVDTLPDTLKGRDVLGRGKTGSGKTLAFSIPLVARLGGALAGGRRRPGRPLALVLSPTRELATQISAVITPLAKAYDLKTTTIFGGVNQSRQVNALNEGVDIVVACPGRLEDLMKQGHVTLDAIEITVLDEADHMADLGFLPVVTRLMNKTPKSGQRMLFSATLDNGVDKLVSRYLRNQVLHSVDEANSPVAAMTHHVFVVEGALAKRALVRKLASGTGRRILFTRTKHAAKKLARELTAGGIPALDLHGNLTQGIRDRNLAAFAAGDVRVLVATDVAARGVHVDDIELVVHVDPPAEHKAYLHRSGRTARAGKQGEVVTITQPSQRKETEELLRRAKISVRPRAVTADSPAVVELVGEVAEIVMPVFAQDQSRRNRPTGVRTSGGGEVARRGAHDGGREGSKPRSGRSQSGRSQSGKPLGGKPKGGKSQSGKPLGGKPKGGKSQSARGQARNAARGGAGGARGGAGGARSSKRTRRG